MPRAKVPDEIDRTPLAPLTTSVNEFEVMNLMVIGTVVQLKTGQLCTVTAFDITAECWGIIKVQPIEDLKVSVKEIRLGDIASVLLPVQWTIRDQAKYTTPALL